MTMIEDLCLLKAEYPVDSEPWDSSTTKKVCRAQEGVIGSMALTSAHHAPPISVADVLSARDLPVFTSMQPPTTKSWREWFLEAIGAKTKGDVLSHNNTTMTFITPGTRNPSIQIGGINGINTSLLEAIGHAEYVKRLMGDLPIEWVYNHSNNAPIDALEAVLINLAGYSPNTARLLQENWIAFAGQNINHPHAKYLQICHSQGAIHVRNALEGLSEEIRKRVVVVAIAPAAIIPGDLCFSAYNYASKSDIVYLAELLAAAGSTALAAARGGKASVWLKNAIDLQSQLILLDPHPEVKGMDHEFQSFTFLPIIEDHVMDYLQREGNYYT